MAFSLQRTNTRITGNIKLVIGDSNRYYLETIDSSLELARLAYKGNEYDINQTYIRNIKSFSNIFTETDILYDVLNEQDLNISNNLSEQYSQNIYDYGCYSSPEKVIKSKHRFFAPLHISEDDINDNKLPEAFIIYRLPNVDNSSTTDQNIRFNDTLKSGELVKVFDLSDINNSITSGFKDSSIIVDFSNNLSVSGIDLINGQNALSSENTLQDILANERTVLEFENFITNIYKRHNLIFSNIINFEFAFDDNSTGNFNRYVGFYVNYNEVTKTDIDNNEYTLKLLRTEDSIVKYNPNVDLNEYTNQVGSSTGLSFGKSSSPMIQVNVMFSPNVGESLELLFNGVSELNIPITNVLVGNTRSESRDLIVSEINRLRDTTDNISIVARNVGEYEFVIESTVDGTYFEGVSVNLPNTFIVDKVIYSSIDYLNTFYGGSRRTLLSNKLIPFSDADTINIKDDDGVFTDYKIDRIIETELGLYQYRFTERIVNKNSTPSSILFIKTLTDQPLVCSVLDHKYLDFDKNGTDYEDVLDFNLELFNDYLTGIVNQDDYRGGADTFYDSLHPGEPATEAEVQTYKNNVINIINNYSGDIELVRNYLIKNINISTRESIQTTNEYLRLNENTLPALTNVNNLVGFISKWKLKNGLDCYYNPYRLNVSQSFGYTSFTPSQLSSGRDIRYHTHSWLISGEGGNPYYELNENTVRKHLGYSSEPLNETKLIDINTNAFKLLEYSTDFKTHEAYEKIVYDSNKDRSIVFFKGVLLEFVDSSLDGYDFAAILKSRTPTDSDDTGIKLIRNDRFKTLTLLVDFYIPDPVLTSLERGSDFYYLDNSLPYFSNEIYATTDTLIDFGNTEISLRLYDTTTVKSFNDSLSVLNWYYIDSTGERFVYVGRGDGDRFDTPFQDILNLGEDFIVFDGDIDDINSPLYGIRITFKNIQEIGGDYFWCKEIEIVHIETIDPDTPLDPTDNTIESVVTVNVLDQFLSNSNLFYENNIVHVSSALAYENIVYNKSIRPSVNTSRYNNLSVSYITDYLNNNNILVNRVDVNGNSTNEFTICRSIDSTQTEIVVKLISNSNESISTLNNKYLYPIKRYDGDYVPIVKDLINFSDLSDVSRSVFNLSLGENRYRLKVSNTLTDSFRLSESYNETYLRSLVDNSYSVFRSLDDLQTTFESLQWIASPDEFRSFTSIVLNSEDELTIQVSASNNIINILEQFGPVLLKYCNLDLFSDLTNEQRSNIINLYTDTTQNTLNFDLTFENVILKQFIDNLFFKIYNIDRVMDMSGNSILFYSNNEFINIFSSSIASEFSVSTTYNVILTR